MSFLKWLLGDENKFVIFKNPKYSRAFGNGYAYSVKHLGGYLYINPFYGGYDEGAGISPSKSACASHNTVEECKDLIKRWVEMTYPAGHETNIFIEE